MKAPVAPNCCWLFNSLSVPLHAALVSVLLKRAAGPAEWSLRVFHAVLSIPTLSVSSLSESEVRVAGLGFFP